ncbi:hypothetical protein SAMN05216593_12630 [Pseudomonas asturiensis]|uniref:Uncharacterized protein n=1 Tax=Pseudomonas asturiensis TaxID=1190415 RepID=A0A1M7QHP2_9PSED|nr:hypothetical protein [Pseudomonas asturiensis]SHN30261.1 hypothetical protein SAMN05216593_12630 [Pseudomonas asturiensis]
MTLQTRNWTARLVTAPGAEPLFCVDGIVTVGNTAVEPKLVVSPLQDRSHGLKLELVLEDKYMGLQVINEKHVLYRQAGGAQIPNVTVWYQGEELVHIEQVSVTG